MDAFVNAFAALSQQLIPIVGLVILVILAIFLLKMIGLVKTLDATFKKTDTTIDLVDQSLNKMQSPLDTVVKVSNTVDKAHDATLQTFANAKDYISKNAETIKGKVKTVTDTLMSKSKKSPDEKPRSDDDTGGMNDERRDEEH